MKFTEAQLEAAILDLLGQQGLTPVWGETLARAPESVLIEADLFAYLRDRYGPEGLTEAEMARILGRLQRYPALDLYESNKAIMKLVADGFILKRDDPQAKDLYIELIDYTALGPQRPPDPAQLTQLGAEPLAPTYRDANRYKVVRQLEIQGFDNKRIPDAVVYLNGLPLVVMEFKSAIREEATLFEAFTQLTVRYRRDIPELFKYNAFCVISDGANTKAGSFFAPYAYWYAWRRTEGMARPVDGIDALYSLLQGMFDRRRLRDIIQNFVLFPDVSHREEKIVCRYPQYYAARRLFAHIKAHQKPAGDGKGGTYFGATGSGKSYTMLFLTRLLMRSPDFRSPTIVLITDRTDLDDQLSEQFENAKAYIGDQTVQSVASRADLRAKLQGRQSGGVFLTTIHKFTEDTRLLSQRSNIICISDEAHRSQLNLQQTVRVTGEGVKKSFGFAKYLHASLPNATFVGFTGTPIDATYQVFGPVVDTYTMTESVFDEITVRIVYEGRAARVLLDHAKLQEIEAYYAACAEEGANAHQIEESKKAMAQMRAIIGDPDRIKAIAADFVAHYEQRLEERATVQGKAMFVCSTREIAYALYREVIALRPAWAEARACAPGAALSEAEKKVLKPLEYIKLVMTRGKDDPKELYDLLGTKEYRKELDRQFKNPKSNFKIAIVVDMWLTGFDVPFLDTLYLDKPVQQHNLIQTISRVNRKVAGKEKGLVVDYLGIKKQMNLALAKYSKGDEANIEDVERSITIVRDHLDLLDKLLHRFDASPYFSGSPLAQLHTLNLAAEFVQQSQEAEKRFMGLTKRLKAAYDICVSTQAFADLERDRIAFYLAVRSIVFKLTRGDAPDAAQMNRRVEQMIAEAIQSQGVEELYKMGEDDTREVDLFDAGYLAKLDKIKLPNTKIKLLQKLLARAIEQYKRINRLKGIDFSKRMQALVDRYNDRDPNDVLRGEVLEDFTEEIMNMIEALRQEMTEFGELGIDLQEKAFYDILKALAVKYDFTYPEDKLIPLAQAVKHVVDDKAKYTDWSKREDVKAELKVDLILLLAEHDYPPVDRDEVYQEIFAQAENYKRNR